MAAKALMLPHTPYTTLKGFKGHVNRVPKGHLQASLSADSTRNWPLGSSGSARRTGAHSHPLWPHANCFRRPRKAHTELLGSPFKPETSGTSHLSVPGPWVEAVGAKGRAEELLLEPSEQHLSLAHGPPFALGHRLSHFLCQEHLQSLPRGPFRHPNPSLPATFEASTTKNPRLGG